jgi:hypothetical protein
MSLSLLYSALILYRAEYGRNSSLHLEKGKE